MTRNQRIPLITLCSFFLLGGTGCKKDERGGVPLTPLDISINVNNPSYIDLSVPGGWLYLSGGSQGLIVYRASNDEFVALDRHCPYQPTELCRVVVDESEIQARDTTCCHSSFLITDGSVLEGPAALNLQRYNTSFNGTILRIYN
ncbi:MAG: hypothetical protein JNL43_05865 [Flavobacteriales bacterium]|nr:hypothetical protein [Flavobacteriales bacterium]HRH70981.1 hypothetical protein [Flavobacteriales bacterium]